MDGNLVQRKTKAHMMKLEEIKTAAARQFYSLGYAATDVRSIADAVQLHVSTLYTYISGKEELLFLIMKDGIQGARSAVEAALAKSDEPVEALHNAVEAMVLHHASRRFLAWTSHVEIRSLSGQYRDDILRMQSDYEQIWLDLIEKGRDSGAFDVPDVKLAMYVILSAGHGVSNWFRPDGRLPVERVAVLIARQLLSGIQARPDPAAAKRT
jgi:TetR/AcrR family transcriptional regulator, cholesterol catabolism regulator